MEKTPLGKYSTKTSNIDKDHLNFFNLQWSMSINPGIGCDEWTIVRNWHSMGQNSRIRCMSTVGFELKQQKSACWHLCFFIGSSTSIILSQIVPGDQKLWFYIKKEWLRSDINKWQKRLFWSSISTSFHILQILLILLNQTLFFRFLWNNFRGISFKQFIFRFRMQTDCNVAKYFYIFRRRLTLP